MNFLTTIFENIGKLTGFITGVYKKEVTPIYVKVENKSNTNKFNR